MATASAFNALAVAALDDSMEVSSPFNRNVDDDLDIDFEDYPSGDPQPADDERMVEDSGPTRPPTATDDSMEDGVVAEEQTHEEIMQDDIAEHVDAQPTEDDELIDYGDEEWHHQQDDTTMPNVVEAASADQYVSGLLDEETVDEKSPHPADEAIPGEFDSRLSGHGTDTNDHAFADSTDSQQAEEHEPHSEKGDNGKEGIAAFAEADTEELPQQRLDEISKQASTRYRGEKRTHASAVNSTVSTVTDVPGTPTDTGLHTMILHYGDLEMPLFRSRHQPDGLLGDDNLASLSLAELIRSCREKLALHIGEEISEDQELVLAFEDMGLMLVEDSRASFESSLEDIIDVFLQLHRNDGVEDAPALALHLSLQLKFASSFNTLKQAAAGGQGMGAFSFLHVEAHSDVDQEQGEEDHVEQSYQEGYAHGKQIEEVYGEDSDPEHQQRTSTYDAEADGDRGPTSQDLHGPDVAEDADRHDEGRHFADEEEGRGKQAEEDHAKTSEAMHAYKDAGQEIIEFNGAATQLPGAEGRLEPGAPEEETHQRLFTGESSALESHGVQAPSAPSSTTVQGDHANDIGGEYEEDVVDWEDDTLTSFAHVENEDDPEEEDISNFLNNEEVDVPQAQSSAGGTYDAISADQQATDIAKEHQTGYASGEEGLGSGALLEDLGHSDVVQRADASTDHYGRNAEEEEEGINEADNYDGQHEEYYPDDQSGEDYDQYHTVTDSFNEVAQHDDELRAFADEHDSDDAIVPAAVGEEDHIHAQDQHDFPDDLNFDDDEVNLTPHGIAGKDSPLGKRSHEEASLFDDADDNNEEPKLKKAKASQTPASLTRQSIDP